MKDDPKKYKRNCPSCGTILNYKGTETLNRAIKRNSNCKPCSKLGENHPMYGKPKEYHPMFGKFGKDNPNYGRKNTPETIQKMSEAKLKYNPFKGKSHTKENIELFSKLNTGKNNSMYGKSSSMRGKHYSKEVCKKHRIVRIAEIERSAGQIMPNYNKSSISILEAKAKELGINDLQHAENGGEYHIKELGYFVDGYSKDKNIVFEYYERHHSKQIEKDMKRQKEITDLLKCKFIIIKE